MSTKAVQDTSAEKQTLSMKMNEFLLKNRVMILSFIAGIALVLAGLFVFTVVTENRNESAFASVDAIMNDWESARSAEDKAGLPAKEDGFIESLKKIAASGKNSFGGARANMTIAEIYFSRKDWQNAQAFYLAAAKDAPKAYTAGLNYFNAGICADELGNADDAVSFLNDAVALDNFSMKPRALFNIGRIEEQRSNLEAANAAYGKMAEAYPDDDWTLLAKSRIIALKIK